jgi:hypothetical protein
VIKPHRKWKNQGIEEAFDTIFQSQVSLLKKLEADATVQSDIFDNLNHNILENYRILLELQISNLISTKPYDENSIIDLYDNYKNVGGKNLKLIEDWKNRIS